MSTETYEEFEERVRRRALELTAGAHPAFNLSPTIDLVRQAFAAGYDLVPLQPQQKLSAHVARGVCRLANRPACDSYPQCQCGQTLPPARQGM